VLFLAPYTQTANLAKSHIGGAQFIISNTSGFYDKMTSKGNDETVTGKWTFPSNANRPTADTDTDTATDTDYITRGQLARTAVASAVAATPSTVGYSKLSSTSATPTAPVVVETADTRVPTQGENDALVGNNTDVAVGTGNKFVTQTGLQHNAEKYAADNEATDTYVITLAPAPTSYTNGMVVYFYAKTVNTGAASLNVNGLGAKTIVKEKDTTLANGDIKAGQLVAVIYDGTNFQMISPVGVPPITTAYVPTITSGVTSQDVSATGAVNIAHRLGGIPKQVRITMMYASNSASVTQMSSIGNYNGVTTSCVYEYYIASTGASGTSNSNIVVGVLAGGSFSATIATDATNITLTWAKTSSPTGTVSIMWEALK
jgi:hypothetical protein